MTSEIVIDVVREGLYTVLLVAAPPLVMGLAAGLIMAIFQTVTSIQEPTLAFIPKILAVLGSLIIAGPFMINQITGFVLHVTEHFEYFMGGG